MGVAMDCGEPVMVNVRRLTAVDLSGLGPKVIIS